MYMYLCDSIQLGGRIDEAWSEGTSVEYIKSRWASKHKRNSTLVRALLMALGHHREALSRRVGAFDART